MRRILLTLTTIAVAGLASGLALAKTSHKGWPKRTGILYIAPNSDSHKTGTAKNDELLGGHGSDTLDGGKGDDVIWGDQHPSGNTTKQHDTLIGGTGRDWFYASHGYNNIDAGSGRDVIHAHYGNGIIDCGGGADVLYVSHKSQKRYKIRHCETISYKTEGR